MSLLTMVQDISVLVGLNKPTAALTSTDQTTVQIVAFLQQEGDEIARGVNWQTIKISGTITGDGLTTVWSVPADFDRFIPDNALWSLKYPAVPLGGPVTDAEMLAMKSLPIQPVRPIWRFFGSFVEIWPALGSSELVQVNYLSKSWIGSADGSTFYSRWVADTDVPRLPENVMTLGGIWRWKRSKGFDYAEEFRTYQQELDRQKGQSGGARIIQMSGGLRPDGIWGPSPVNPIVVT